MNPEPMRPFFETENIAVYWDGDDLRLRVYGDKFEFSFGKPFGHMLVGFGFVLFRFPSTYELVLNFGLIDLELVIDWKPRTRSFGNLARGLLKVLINK